MSWYNHNTIGIYTITIITQYLNIIHSSRKYIYIKKRNKILITELEKCKTVHWTQRPNSDQRQQNKIISIICSIN